jgi:hypothetical protein
VARRRGNRGEGRHRLSLPSVSRSAESRHQGTFRQVRLASPYGRHRADPGPALPVGHAYLCEDPDGLALIDTSVPGSAPQIAAAIRTLGHDPADLRWLLLALGVPNLRAWAGVRMAGGLVLVGLGVVTLSFGGNDRKTYGWTMAFLVAAAAESAGRMWIVLLALLLRFRPCLRGFGLVGA